MTSLAPSLVLGLDSIVLTDALDGVASLTPCLIVLGIDSIVPPVAHLATSPPLSPIVTDKNSAHVVVGKPNL